MTIGQATYASGHLPKTGDRVVCIEPKGKPEVYSLDPDVVYTVELAYQRGDLKLEGKHQIFREERFVLVERAAILPDTVDSLLSEVDEFAKLLNTGYRKDLQAVIKKIKALLGENKS